MQIILNSKPFELTPVDGYFPYAQVVEAAGFTEADDVRVTCIANCCHGMMFGPDQPAPAVAGTIFTVNLVGVG